MTRVHTLKTLPAYFRDVQAGRKPFEVRRNDRDYQVDDLLVLMEYASGEYSGSAEVRRITYVLPGGQFGIEDGYCVLGLEEVA